MTRRNPGDTVPGRFRVSNDGDLVDHAKIDEVQRNLGIVAMRQQCADCLWV